MKNKLMQYATKEEIISCAISLLDNQIRENDLLCSPKQTREFLTLQLSDELAEVFCVLFLDNHHRVISFDRMFNGTINGASVYPREVVRAAIKRNASAVIFAHNHPSGVAEPSDADITITKRLTEALALIDVRVLDHFVVGDEVVSMAESGLM